MLELVGIGVALAPDGDALRVTRDAAIAAAEKLVPGEFILYERGGGAWDETIYVVPKEFVVNR